MTAYRTKEAAEKAMADLIKKLNGTGWKSDVWDNPEEFWHVRATLGWMDVLDSGPVTPQSYWTLLGEDCGGEIYWSPSAHFDDPNDAVEYQLELAEKYMAVREKAIAFVRNIVNGEDVISLTTLTYIIQDQTKIGKPIHPGGFDDFTAASRAAKGLGAVDTRKDCVEVSAQNDCRTWKVGEWIDGSVVPLAYIFEVPICKA